MPSNNTGTAFNSFIVDNNTARFTDALRNIRYASSGDNDIPIDVTTEDSFVNTLEETRKLLLSDMKKRHLRKNERDIIHNPKRDWISTGKGEVCRSSSVLEVDDLIAKHCK